MEQSAFEAVMIGVNVFVFIIALTAGILLMTNVLNMVDYANRNAIVGMNGTLAESVGTVFERKYTGTELLTYYRKSLEGNNNIVYYVRQSEGGNKLTIEKFVKDTNNFSTYNNKEFLLEYLGKEGNKDAYVFSLVVEE